MTEQGQRWWPSMVKPLLLHQGRTPITPINPPPFPRFNTNRLTESHTIRPIHQSPCSFTCLISAYSQKMPAITSSKPRAAVCDADDVLNDTLVVVSYVDVESNSTVTVNVQRPHCTRQRTCHFTTDRHLVNHSHAIVFSDRTQLHNLPQHRTPHQKWVFRTMEVYYTVI